MDKKKRNEKIVKMHKAGHGNREIAEKFGMSPQNVYYVLKINGCGQYKGKYNEEPFKEALDKEIQKKKDAALSTVARLNSMNLNQEAYDLIEVLVSQVADYAGLKMKKERAEDILLFKGYDYDERHRCR